MVLNYLVPLFVLLLARAEAELSFSAVLEAMIATLTESCSALAERASAMAFGCNLTRVFNYNGSQTDVWINYATLLLTLVALVLCTRRAGLSASRYGQAAAWFWLPLTFVLFIMQIFADCSTDNVGISAVWSAFTGFIFLGWWRSKHSDKGTASARGGGGSGAAGGGAGGREGGGGGGGRGRTLSSYVTLASIAVWATVCIYYAVVEEAITTVAHAVSFAVGLGAWVLFEKLHQIPLVDPGEERSAMLNHAGGGG